MNPDLSNDFDTTILCRFATAICAFGAAVCGRCPRLFVGFANGCLLLATRAAAVSAFGAAIGNLPSAVAAVFGSLRSPGKLWHLLCGKYRKFALLLQLDA
jgi:hypothetical protein